MKAIVCEMCGSNDLIKNEGFYVCENCGTKYTTEEAKKLMVEISGEVSVKGTVNVTVDETEKIEDYLDLAIKSLENKDYSNALSYSTKVTDIKRDVYSAWVVRSLAAGWDSTPNNITIPEKITAANEAIEYAPLEKKSKIAKDCYYDVKKIVTILISNVYSVPFVDNKVAIKMSAEKIHMIMTNWHKALFTINYLPIDTIVSEIEDCKKMCKKSKSALRKCNQLTYFAYKYYNDKKSYDKTMQKVLEDNLESFKARDNETA